MARRLPAVDDVLTGRAAFDASALVSLIHSVNPTDRGLRPAAAAAAYAQKSRLQSLLLRRYPDQVVIRLDPRDDDLCVLEVPLDGRDAGHARISHLDDDVRPIVWAAAAEPLPTGPASATRPSSSPAPDAPGPETLVEQGDYAGAAEAWCAAARAGSQEAGREALRLWVDWLGEVDRARAAWSSLPDRVQADPVARAVMARGEVRAGALAVARSLLEGAAGEDAGSAWEELGEALLASGDATGARAAARALADADPGRRQAALDLEDRVRAVDDAQRAPLRRAVDDADQDSLAAALTALEAAFPGDAHAARVRARLAAARSQQEDERHLAGARAALAAGQLDIAAAELDRIGVDPPDPVRVAASEVRGRLALLRAEDRIRRVAADLRRDPTTDAVAGWLELDDADRAAAIEGLSLEVVDLAAEMDARVRRRPSQVAEAAMAVLAARAALAESRVEEAHDHLAPHVDLLAGEGRRTLAEVQAALTAERARRARRLLDEAGQALAAADPSAARALAARIIRDRLDEVDQARLDQLLGSLQAEAAEADALATYEALLASEPWRARDLAQSRGAGAWVPRRDAASRATQEAWRARPMGAESSLPVIPHIGMWAHDGRALCSITQDEREMVFAEPLGDHLAVHVAALPDLATVRTLLLRPPVAPRATHVTVHGRRGWIVAKAGWVVEIDLDALEVARWTMLPPGQRVEVLADELCAKSGGGWLRLDPASLRPATAPPRLPVVPQLVAGAPYGVGHERNDYFLCTAEGARPVGALDRPHRRATVATDGRRVVVVAGFDPTPDHRPTRYELWAMEGGEGRRVCALDKVQEPVWLGMHGDLVVVGSVEALGSRYRGIDLATGRVRWETLAPGDTQLFQAAVGGRVGALTLGAKRAELRWLESARSTLPSVGMFPVGVSIEIRSARACDLASASTELEERLLRAQSACDRRDWPGALALLADAPGDGPHQDHIRHLRGLAAMMAGELEIMEAALEPLATRVDVCDVERLLPIARTRAKVGKWFPLGADPHALTAMRGHHDLVRAADAALAKGSPAEAWRVLDDIPSWHTDDAQLAWRRVEAVLRLDGPPLLDVLRALTSLREATGDVPGVPSWSTARLQGWMERGRAEVDRR